MSRAARLTGAAACVDHAAALNELGTISRGHEPGEPEDEGDGESSDGFHQRVS